MRSRAQSDAAASRRRLDPVESNIRRTRDEIDVAQALANLSRRPVNFPDWCWFQGDIMEDFLQLF